MSCAPCRRPWVVFGLTAKLLDEGAAEELQLWKLAVNLEQHMAVLSCEDGNGNAVYRKEIEFTDFPLSEVELYFTNNAILLPSEY